MQNTTQDNARLREEIQLAANTEAQLVWYKARLPKLLAIVSGAAVGALVYFNRRANEKTRILRGKFYEGRLDAVMHWAVQKAVRTYGDDATDNPNTLTHLKNFLDPRMRIKYGRAYDAVKDASKDKFEFMARIAYPDIDAEAVAYDKALVSARRYADNQESWSLKQRDDYVDNSTAVERDNVRSLVFNKALRDVQQKGKAARSGDETVTYYDSEAAEMVTARVAKDYSSKITALPSSYGLGYATVAAVAVGAVVHGVTEFVMRGPDPERRGVIDRLLRRPSEADVTRSEAASSGQLTSQSWKTELDGLTQRPETQLSR